MKESINEIARGYYVKQIEDGLNIDLTVCPEPITKKMLLNELMTSDLKSYIDDVDKDYLWNQYLYINTVSTNKFGFVNSPFYKVEPWQQYLYTGTLLTNKAYSSGIKKKSSTMKRISKKYHIKVDGKTQRTNSKSKTYRTLTPYHSNINRNRKGRSKTYSTPLVYGGGNQAGMRTVVQCLNNGVYPYWSSGYSTIVKITDINNKPIYARGTSLPDPNKPSQMVSVCNQDAFCTNTLNFYRYIKNIPNLISLQGCDLDWTGYKYRPKYCDDLNEKAIWNGICNEYDEVSSPSQMRDDHMKEFYWVDMSAGFFSVYKSISDIDFTDISNSSIIHCLAGFGRTGTVLMLIICINYYKEHPGEYEVDFLTHEPNDPDHSKTSNRIIRKLKWLFHQYIKVDQEIPIDPSIPISDVSKDRIKLALASFDVNKIVDELFTNFYRRGSRNRQVNYTSLNVLVTRINYILYFTARACGMDRVVLYETHEHTYRSVDNSLVMDSMVLSKPDELSLRNVNVLVKNPVIQEIAITELSKRGFDFVFFTRITRANGSSAQRSSRRGRNISRGNTPSLITTELAAVERVAPKKIKKPKCVIS